MWQRGWSSQVDYYRWIQCRGRIRINNVIILTARSTISSLTFLFTEDECRQTLLCMPRRFFFTSSFITQPTVLVMRRIQFRNSVSYRYRDFLRHRRTCMLFFLRRPTLSVAPRPSVRHVRFTRNRKALETSNTMNTWPQTRVIGRTNTTSKGQRSRSLGTKM